MTLPLHITSDYFRHEGGELCINGRSVVSIANEIGTPFYAYDKSVIDRRVTELREVLPEDLKIHYAMKANPMPDVVYHLAELVDGIDIASAGELEIAIETKVPRNEMSFAGPGKSIDELRRAVEERIVLNVESETELDRIRTIASELDITANVAIRVNPDFELKGSGMRMTGGPKPFGIDAEVVPDVLARIRKPLRYMGLHIFTGSQSLNEEAIIDAEIQSFNLALALTKNAPEAPSFINLGGGFGIPYFPGDERLSLTRIGDNLKRLSNNLRNIYPDCNLVIELGRYLIGEAGIYVCQVRDIKISRGLKFLITDGGLHHHLAASGNFGQVIRKNYPIAIANRLNEDPVEKTSVVGPLCTPLDVLGDKVNLPRAQIGDLVAVFQSGAYGYTASPHLFLGHRPPREIFVS